MSDIDIDIARDQLADLMEKAEATLEAPVHELLRALGQAVMAGAESEREMLMRHIRQIRVIGDELADGLHESGPDDPEESAEIHTLHPEESGRPDRGNA